MRRVFCWVGLHLWREDFLRDALICDLCGDALTAESYWRRTGRNLWADR